MSKQISDFQFKHLSTFAKFLSLALFWFGSPLNVMADSVGCNDSFVQMDNDEIVINVTRTNSDDTANIQCALDAAVMMGVPTVRLVAGTYFISRLIVENFNGSFQGATKTTTIIEVLDGSIDCQSMINAGMLATAIKFVKGEPRIRFMTIRSDMPCATGFADAIVHFTGEPASVGNCDNDVIFGVVDRVILDGTSTATGAWAGVSVDPEGRLAGGCKTNLLGTFKLNRSTIMNTFAGVVTSMKSGAQVDINFNEFRGNLQAVNLFESNQNTTITTNKFYGDNTPEDIYFGVFASNFNDNPPPTTRMVVHNNEFYVDSSSPGSWSIAVDVEFQSDEIISNVSSVVTNNRFILSGNRTYGVWFADTSNAHVSANRFNGSGARAIYAGGTVPVSGWTITANTGLAGFTSDLGGDIRLAANTSGCIVGPGQGASVQDDSGANTILPQ